MPVDHYENFPVASFLLPRHLRKPIETIYRFARSADDFADEGDLADSARLELLDGYRQSLHRLSAGQRGELGPLFLELAHWIESYDLPVELFHDLLDAFSQDVTTKRYANIRDLMDYCSRSANPIGRLLVHLNKRQSEQTLRWSDAICSALQLINFWQDVAVDWRKGRVYLPQEDLERFSVSESDIADARTGDAWQALMAFQCQRARELLESGRPLTRALPGRMGYELRFVLAGGHAILDKIDAVKGDVFRRRPVLGTFDWIVRAPAALLA
ncbi:MAG: squalene synthase HpnC [Betaproteobacteria bacterium]|nr:squalene synthase HpnC [Betaproteobacteria bacterium]